MAHAKRSKHERELQAAADIRQSLMIVKTLQLPFVTVAGKNLPCAEIGGRFFMEVAVVESLVAVIADVSGEGTSAAVMASLLR